MTPSINAALALFISCLGIWFFADTLLWSENQRQLIRETALNETVLKIGTTSPCVTEVHLSIWESMNQLEIYRWVVACEDSLDKKETK